MTRLLKLPFVLCSLLGCSAAPPTETLEVQTLQDGLTLVGSCPSWTDPTYAVTNNPSSGDVYATPADNLQAKYDTVPAGKCLVMSSGTFNTHLVLRNNTCIKGQGPANTIIQSTYDGNVVSSVNIQNVAISGVTFNGGNHAGHCFRSANTDGLDLENIRAFHCGDSNSGYAFGFQYSSNNTTDGIHKNISMTNIFAKDIAADGIDFKNRKGQNTNIVLNRVRVHSYGNNGTAHKTGIDLRGDDIEVTDAWITQLGHSDNAGVRTREDSATNGPGGTNVVLDGIVVLATSGLTGAVGLELKNGPVSVDNYCVNVNITHPCWGDDWCSSAY